MLIAMLCILDCNALVTEMDMDSDDSHILSIAYVLTLSYYYIYYLHILHEM